MTAATTRPQEELMTALDPNPRPAPRALTGRKVLLICTAVFATVLGANLALVYHAVGTFSGAVVDNAYVASQSFDDERRAQEALGWTVALSHEDGLLRLAITDAAGRIVRPETLNVVVGRPTSRRTDRALALQRTPAGHVAEADLEPGAWLVQIDAVASDGTAYRRREPLTVPTT